MVSLSFVIIGVKRIHYQRIRAETNLSVSTIRGMSAKARAAALTQNVNSDTLYDTLSPLFNK